MPANPEQPILGRARFPGESASEAEILTYRDLVFDQNSSYRRRQEARWAIAMQYVIDNQWLDFLSLSIPDVASAGYALRSLQSDDDSPRPVTNIITPSIEMELAAYAKRKYMPKVSATSTDKWDDDIAKKMTDVLTFRADKENWRIIRQRCGFFMCASGTGGVRSYWDDSYEATVKVASPYAMECPACKKRLFSNRIDISMKEKVGFNSEYLKSTDSPTELELTHCPSCGATAPLQKALVNEADLGTVDIFGRSMAMTLPKGEPMMQSLSPFEMYPENSGVGINTDNWRSFGVVFPCSLDWFNDHYPNHIDLIRPESQRELLRRNPLLGEFSAYGWYGSALDGNIYADHANMYELISKPCRRFPTGRLIRVVGNIVLESSSLMVKHSDPLSGEPRYVPKVVYATGVYFERPGEFWGHGKVDKLMSVQNRLNARDAQVSDINERLANPHIIAANDLMVDGPEWFEGPYSGKILRYERSTISPEDKPSTFGGVSPPQGLWQERNAMIQDSRMVDGPQEIQQGAAAKNVSTTSGMRLLSENAEQRYSPREDMLNDISKSVWVHHMEMLQAFAMDDQTYEVQDERTKRWRTEVYNSASLSASLRLEIEKSAFVEKSLYDREAAREAQADGLYVIQKPADRKRLLEVRGLPTDVNADEDHQVSAAQDQWSDFLIDGKIPVLDPKLDNATIHWDILSTALLSPDGKRISSMANWEVIVELLTDWEVRFQERVTMDTSARAHYGEWTTQQEADAKYADELLQFQQAQQTFPMEMQEFHMQLGVFNTLTAQGQPAMPPVQPMEPVPPPLPLLLPRPLDKKILTVWNDLLNGQQIPPPDNIDPQKFVLAKDTFLRFRAVVEAYRMMATGQAPVPTPAATPPGVPPEPPNPPNPMNVPTPGTSQALNNAGAAGMPPPGQTATPVTGTNPMG